MKKLILFISIINCFYGALSQGKAITENFLNNVGDSVVVAGKIYGGAYLIHVKTKPTFLNLGDTSPNHRLIIRIEPEDRDKFPKPPETYYINKYVQVKGKLQDYKGAPMIQLTAPDMIKTATVDTTTVNVLNNYTTISPATTPRMAEAVLPAVTLSVPNSILQTNWIKSVTEKAEEEKKRNLHLVEKRIDLRTAPFKDAPLIAQLQPGLQISVLYTSKKWSYVSIGSVDGFHNVNGFIRHRNFRHLPKLPLK